MVETVRHSKQLSLSLLRLVYNLHRICTKWLQIHSNTIKTNSLNTDFINNTPQILTRTIFIYIPDFSYYPKLKHNRTCNAVESKQNLREEEDLHEIISPQSLCIQNSCCLVLIHQFPKLITMFPLFPTKLLLRILQNHTPIQQPKHSSYSTITFMYGTPYKFLINKNTKVT